MNPVAFSSSWRRPLLLGLLALAGCAAQQQARREETTVTSEGVVLSDSIRQRQQGSEKVTEFDLNGDKKPDAWNYTVESKGPDGKPDQRLVRKELDINWDGRVDISRQYDEKEQMIQEKLDLDFDGKVDQVSYFEKNMVVRKERDLVGAGKPSEWLFYEKAKLVRKEKDLNGDGKPDYWEYWEGDQVDRIGQDTDGDGTVDRWTKNPNSEG
jgi:hypothetical protein